MKPKGSVVDDDAACEGRGREGRNRVQCWEFRSFFGFCKRILYVCFSVFLENEPGGEKQVRHDLCWMMHDA